MFDTNEDDPSGSQFHFQARSFEWSTGKLAAGTHTVTMQAMVTSSGCCTVTFDIRHYDLVVERVGV